MNQKNNSYSSIFKSWNVVYPIFIYYVAMNIAMALLTMIATSLLGADYTEQYMAIQTAAVAVTIPFIYRYYERDRKEPTVFHQHLAAALGQKSQNQKILNGVFMFLTGAAAGIVLNNLMAMTALEEISAGYQEANEHFFAGGVLAEILGACLVIPVLEEMLYRSVVYGRICDLMIPDAEETKERGKRNRRSRWIAMVLTALAFGAMHMNLVQFLYASVLGLLLSWFVEKSGHLYGAVLGHIGANLMSVLRMETKAFVWMESSTGAFLGATAVLAAVSVLLIFLIWKWNHKDVLAAEA